MGNEKLIIIIITYVDSGASQVFSSAGYPFHLISNLSIFFFYTHIKKKDKYNIILKKIK